MSLSEVFDVIRIRNIEIARILGRKALLTVRHSHVELYFSILLSFHKHIHAHKYTNERGEQYIYMTDAWKMTHIDYRKPCAV